MANEYAREYISPFSLEGYQEETLNIKKDTDILIDKVDGLIDYLDENCLTNAEVKEYIRYSSFIKRFWGIYACSTLLSFVILYFVCKTEYSYLVGIDLIFSMCLLVPLIVSVCFYLSTKRSVVIFIRRNFRKSYLFQAEFEKVKRRGRSSYVLVFRDEVGKVHKSSISESLYEEIKARSKDKVEVIALKYPKWSVGYGYQGYIADKFKNKSKVKMVR